MNGKKARAARKERGKQYLIERLARAVQLNKRAKFTAAKREFIAKEKAEIEAELKKDRAERKAAAA
jgi:hypothetical protein